MSPSIQMARGVDLTLSPPSPKELHPPALTYSLFLNLDSDAIVPRIGCLPVSFSYFFEGSFFNILQHMWETLKGSSNNHSHLSPIIEKEPPFSLACRSLLSVLSLSLAWSTSCNPCEHALLTRGKPYFSHTCLGVIFGWSSTML